MKLIAFYNEQYKPLKDHFLSTLKDDFELDIDLIPTKGEIGKGGGGKPIWQARTQWTLEKIRKHKNEIVLFCDLDMQFFQPIKDDILALLEDNDVLFQQARPNRKSVNIGIMVTKCNSKIETLWELAHNFSRYGIQDEDIINTILNTRNNYYHFVENPLQIKYGFLPRTYAITHFINKSNIHRLMLHHETSTRFVEIKLEIMSKISKQHAIHQIISYL